MGKKNQSCVAAQRKDKEQHYELQNPLIISCWPFSNCYVSTRLNTWQTLTSRVQAVWRVPVWGEPGSGERTLHRYCRFYCTSPEEGRWTRNNIQHIVNNKNNDNNTHKLIITDDVFVRITLLAAEASASRTVTALASETQQALDLLRNWPALNQMACLHGNNPVNTDMVTCRLLKLG